MLDPPSTSPPAKRTKLEDSEPLPQENGDHDEDLEDNCSICLQPMEDRTVIPTCSHEFCFDCLMIWTAQSRRCPLCTQTIGEYVIHDIRSRFDYRKYHLAPLRSNSPQPLLPLQTTAAIEARNAARRRRERQHGRQQREELDERDKLEMSIATRRWIYKHDLYAKHVASNSYTKYRPHPTPAQFAASPDLISRTTTFLRRELQVWEGLDIEFLTNLIISLMKSIDIRSESAVKLLAEFLDMDAPYEPGNRHVNAEHFAHEVYSYVRSPYRDLFVYDNVVQYDRPANISPPPQRRQHRTRWRERSQGRAEHDGPRPSSRSPRQGGHRRSHSDERRQGIRKQHHLQSDTTSASVHSSPRGEMHRPDEPEASNSRRASSNQPHAESAQEISYDSGFRNDDVPILSTSGKGKERDNEVSSERTAQYPHRPSNGHQAGDAHAQKTRTLEPILMHPRPETSPRAVNSTDYGVANPWASHVNRTEDPKGKRKIDQLNSPRTLQFIDKTHDEISASLRPQLPCDRQQSIVSGTVPRARFQQPRLKTLVESVQAHLKTRAPMPQVINTTSGDSVPSCHAFPGENSHYQAVYHERLSLLQRLSDPVTSFVDEEPSAQRCATCSHRQDENDSDGTSALGLTSESKSRAASYICRTGERVIPRYRNVISSTLVSLDNNEVLCAEQQRPSSLHDGHQDNSMEYIHDVTPRLPTSVMEEKSAAGANAMRETIPEGGAESGTPTMDRIPSSPVPARASDSLCINRVRDREGRDQLDQAHVGSTPRPATATTTSIYTHGPPNSAPIMMHQDQSRRESLGSGLRAKLLSRLGEERKQACEASSSMLTNPGLNKEGEEHRGRPTGSPLATDGAPATSAIDRMDRTSQARATINAGLS